MIEKLTQILLQNIKQGSVIWVVVPPIPTMDVVAAALVLASFGTQRNASVFVVAPTIFDEKLKKHFPETSHITRPPTSFGVQLVIEPSMPSALQATLEQQDGTIVVTIPGTHTASLKHITPWQTTPDSSIILGMPKRAMLESSYPSLSPSIKNSPTTVITSSIETEPWGDLTIVEPRTSGVSELLARAILAMEPNVLSKRDATMLYLGVIDSTRGFTTRNQFPQTYETVATLIERGADHAHVIESLYLAKELKELKVWGRALARLERDVHRNIVWTHIAQSDLERTATTPEEARGVLDELIGQASGNDIAVLAIEHEPNRIEVNIKSLHYGFPLTELFWKYSPLGDNSRIVFIIQQTLLAAEREVLETLTKCADKLRGTRKS